MEAYMVTTVPEPGTLALLARRLLGLIAYAWRKRKIVRNLPSPLGEGCEDGSRMVDETTKPIYIQNPLFVVLSE